MIETVIVILNYNTPHLTLACLDSLTEELSTGTMCAVIVDGASTDDSVTTITSGIEQFVYACKVSLVALSSNRGYAAGNNSVIRDALRMPGPPTYIHILNPDTVIAPRAISCLVEFMKEHPRCGIAGSHLQHSDGAPQCCSFRFPSLLSELDAGARLGVLSHWLSPWSVQIPSQSKPRRVDWVSGASFMVRTDVFRDIGLFDDGYFLYYEEVDFCSRACCIELGVLARAEQLRRSFNWAEHRNQRSK